MDIPFETPVSHGSERKEYGLPESEVLKGEGVSEIEQKYGVNIACYAIPSRGLINVSNVGLKKSTNNISKSMCIHILKN